VGSLERFEFILDGPPVSQQTRRRERLHAWKLFVRGEAAKRWPQGQLPFLGPVKVSITYFYGMVGVDVDNIIKPILDALVGLVYVDDEQVTDLQSRKRILSGVRVGQVSDVLAEGFGRGRDFLHVLVAPAPDQEID
jgi:Holliday junction resolvase RusA-like endonuclease